MPNEVTIINMDSIDTPCFPGMHQWYLKSTTFANSEGYEIDQVEFYWQCDMCGAITFDDPKEVNNA